MNQSLGPVRSVVVIGGGITGLASAHRLLELDSTLDVKLLEGSDRLGGVLRSVQRDGFLLEHSADNFITNVPWAIDLCRRIGIENELLPTDPSRRNAFVVRRGRLLKLPDGFQLMAPKKMMPVLTSPILSLQGKLRLACELFVPRKKTASDESLSSFATRRLGREAFERLVQPLIGGIYTADPKKLSVAATMPRFLEMEQQHGSLIRAAWHQSRKSEQGDDSSSGARYGMFAAPKNGMSSLIEAVARKLPAGTVKLNSPVEGLSQKDAGKWQVNVKRQKPIDCDAIILATHAYQAADLLPVVDSLLAEKMREIPYAGTSVVLLGFRKSQLNHPLDGFGFVVPAVENRKILAASFSSIKFPGRAPEDSVLIRVFVGGACQSELTNLPDEELLSMVRRELKELLGVKGQPQLSEILRWQKAMPQYHIGHLALVDQIMERAGRIKNFQLAGNAYHGVGIPNCIHSGEQAAERLLANG